MIGTREKGVTREKERKKRQRDSHIERKAEKARENGQEKKNRKERYV